MFVSKQNVKKVNIERENEFNILTCINSARMATKVATAFKASSKSFIADLTYFTSRRCCGWTEIPVESASQ